MAARVSAIVDAEASQAVKAQLRLRELILSGGLAAGERIAELAIVERLGMSRTPIRSALVRLEQEGLLEAMPGGGFKVRTFSQQDVADAIELRGTVEGLAARLAAERGVEPALMQQARECIDAIDVVLAQPRLNDASFGRYVELNRRFHALLCQMCGSTVIARELERVVNLPFASPSAFVLVQANVGRSRDMLIVAQDQHREVLEAMAAREGARAEAIMREHSRIAQRNLRDAMGTRHLQRHVPGARLIQEPGS